VSRHLIVPSAAIVIVLLTGCSDDAPSATADPNTAASPVASAAALEVGSTVDNGRLEVTVTGFACATPVDGNKDCRLTVRVSNGTDLEQAFVHTEQFLLDDRGTQYGASLEAMTKDKASMPVLEPVRPGQTVTGVLHYQVPADAVITTARLTEPGQAPTDYDVANL
jgi:hypothetical protein